MNVQRKKTIALGAAVLAALPFAAPVAVKIGQGLLELHDDLVRIQTRLDLVEERLLALEGRGYYLHGKPTTEETRAIHEAIQEATNR